MDRIEPVGGSHPSLPTQFDQQRLQPPSSSNVSSASVQPSGRPPRPRAVSVFSQRAPTIRLQRLPSLDQTASSNQPVGSTRYNPSASGSLVPPGPSSPLDDDDGQGNRRRSSSEPRRGRWSAPNPQTLTRLTTCAGDHMQPLMEESSHQSPIAHSPSNLPFAPAPLERPAPVPLQRSPGRNLLRRTSEATINRFARNRANTVSGPVPPPPPTDCDVYKPHVVDVLDVIDPEVSALSTLTNVQNSLFVPNLGPFVNRNQTYTLSPSRPVQSEEETTATEEESEGVPKKADERPPLTRPLSSVSAALDEGEPRFAILPDGTSLEGWTRADVEELNDHVRHMLHSRRSKFKRSMKGFGKYVSKPLGFLVTLYATLITLFGLAWVLFLIGWINVGGRQLEIINYIDYVLVALFAIMGDGLAPFRAVDTYHMIFVAHYTFLTWKVRRKRRLPALKDKNDLPARREYEIDVEWGDTPKDERWEFTVLSRLQQQRLTHHQNKLSKSHTFYKPHETFTHHAFPQRLLIAIVVLLDCHSLFQISLGACTWGIDYHNRPFALTTVILCCSIACNITGGVLIMIGDRRTRKKEVVERMFVQQLTEEAMKKIEKKKHKKEKQASQARSVAEATSEAGEKSDVEQKSDLPAKPDLKSARSSSDPSLPHTRAL
ncbi:hypothetical protein BDW42DRAFT_165413 [Aspergillus taichungensis]|uniref:Integral membrane protein n=1 Tax=Aspergillus taichungensis TaxID=482145 RepID=A0A2J5I062_9EURO|nr:hypothetical protein BDW42DRAFT_165413 [Aspergillus taichungensis]